MDKALVLFSGGLDSTVALALAVKKYGHENVTALSIYYGQKHDKESIAAKNIALYYNVGHLTLDLSDIFGFGGSTLLKGGGEIKSGEYSRQLKERGIIETYVPFRNGLMISASASVAMAKGASVIFYGAHMDDSAAAYPDCTNEFFLSMQSALMLGSGKLLTLEAPFIEMRKKDIVAKGLELNVPFGLTWSCYKGQDKPCGECATCIDREKAFIENGAVDPLKG